MRDIVITCDAPECTNSQVNPDLDDEPDTWLMATVEVHVPVPDEVCDAPGCDGVMLDSSAQRIDACSMEHLRAAMAVTIAELTDEKVG